MLKPKILGIVNITTDSFSEPGQYLNPLNAIEHAVALHKAGAEIIDLGPAASSPNATIVSAADEITRLELIIEHLHAHNIDVSIDSYLPNTQRYGVEKNVAYLNDINGFNHPHIYPELATASCKLIVMHSIQRSGIATECYSDPNSIVELIADFFERRIGELTAAGIDRERLILDPGMGFFLGNTPEVSINVLKHLPELKQHFDLPLLISVSRKSFLRDITDNDVMATGAANLAAETFALLQGVSYIRTHDVKALHDALLIYQSVGMISDHE